MSSALKTPNIIERLRKEKKIFSDYRDFSRRTLEQGVSSGAFALWSRQEKDGHWNFNCDGNVSTSADYLLFTRLREEPNEKMRDNKLANYIRNNQENDGGWALFPGGGSDLNVSVRAYLALKAVGDVPGEKHMEDARNAILLMGGAAKCDLMTNIWLAILGQIPWRAIPVIPPEIMLLGHKSSYSIYQLSWAARVVIVPLLVIMAKRPTRPNFKVTISELFGTKPAKITYRPEGGFFLRSLRRLKNQMVRFISYFVPAKIKQKALETARLYVAERITSEDGLGGIFPAMIYSVLMLDALGYNKDNPLQIISRRSIDHLLVMELEYIWCLATKVPGRDTCLSLHALIESDDRIHDERVRRGLDWINSQQITDSVGDWKVNRPKAEGGFSSHYSTKYCPDLEVTALAALAMSRLDNNSHYKAACLRAREFLQVMQSYSGGYAQFEAIDKISKRSIITEFRDDLFKDKINAPVTALAILLNAQLGEQFLETDQTKKALNFLLNCQSNDGYFALANGERIYSTWLALAALTALGQKNNSTPIAKAVNWLMATVNEDGGWGEQAANVLSHPSVSTATHTACAILALINTGNAKDAIVAGGVEYLLLTQGSDGFWEDKGLYSKGFPNIPLIRYNGDSKILPLWALARYRNIKHGREIHQSFL